jgi:hypothetical protein
MIRSAAILAGLGATVGSALDALHTYSGTTTYPKPIALKMAWWTPAIFGFAGLSTGLAFPLAEKVLGRSITSEVTPLRAALGFAGFAGLYALSGFLPASNFTKTCVIGAGVVALGATLAPTPEAVVLSLTTAIVGPLVEIALVSRGAFTHNQPDFLGIPMWLPVLYAGGAFAFGVVGKQIVAFVERSDAPASSMRASPVSDFATAA